MPYVVLDPDGTQKLNLMIIVEAKTGVIYCQQCAGTRTEQRELEGFLIPVGGHVQTQMVFDWFQTRFGDAGCNPHNWTPKVTESLAKIISEIRCWDGKDGGPEPLRLNTTRMNECTEAWIPVMTPYGCGILTLNNSD